MSHDVIKKPSAKFKTSMLISEEKLKGFGAAYLTGLICCAAFNPLESLRVRWQCQAIKGDTLSSFVRRVLQKEGLWTGLWRPGLEAYVTSMGLCFGLRMIFYETLRDSIIKARGGKKDFTTMFLSGLVTGSVCYWSVAPIYQMKNRLQGQTAPLLNGLYIDGPNEGLSPKYKNTTHAFQLVIREEGFRSLYTGATALLVRGGCYHTGHMLGYDLTKTVFTKMFQITDGPVLHGFAGLVSAFTACSAACPADCILNTYQNSPLKTQMGVFRFASNFVAENGMSALYRGWSPFLIRVAPLHVFQMSLFEQIRSRLFGLQYFQ